jgi:RNA polymerase sigma-70 factor (ECF subfamily)
VAPEAKRRPIRSAEIPRRDSEPRHGRPADRTAFDSEAVGHLYHLRKASLGLTRNRADAEDLVQDAYVRALRASRRFEWGSDLRAWLLTILRNLARNHRRDQHRARVHANSEDADRASAAVAAPGDSPEEALLSRSMAPQLQRALESLPKALRDAVWLRDVEERSYAEIARHLRIPIGTVMSRISRGRRLLHDRLAAAQSESR